MLTAEYDSRGLILPPQLFDVLVKKIAAGTYTPGEPLVAVHRSGLLRVPLLRTALRDMFEPAIAESGEDAYEVPPPARLIPDPDLRERMPDLFKPQPMPKPPREWSDVPSVGDLDQVFVWLEDGGGTIVVGHAPGRIGILNAGDAEAYLPLVRAAQAQDQVVAALADVGKQAAGLSSATVRVISDRSDSGGA